MATAGDGRAPYEGTGAGGKFRKRPFRRSAPAKPYDRPSIALRNNNPSLFTKLVDPASRLIYAGANRLFGAFRKRLPPLLSQGPPEINEEPQSVPQEAGPNNRIGVSELSIDQGGNSACISATTGISELEQMLKQKTFSRSEIEHLTALLHSRTTESPSNIVERDGAKPPNTPSPLLRLEASTSGTLKKYGDERDNLHAAISTPIISSRVLEGEIASPTELAKAYMGSRPTKVAPLALGLSSQSPRKGSILPNSDVSGLPKTPFTSMVPKTANSFRGLENGFTTPRSRGRSAMYNMARTPYSRTPSTFSQKGLKSDYGHGAALTSPGHEGSNKMALKRRSSVLEDDIGSGGPLRRTRQKANLVSQASYLSRDKRQLGYNSFEQPESASQKLLLMNKPEPKVLKRVEENGETSMRGSGHASVPPKSTQMATKILQQLERLSPKEKPSVPAKLTSNMLHGQALRSMEKVESPKFLPSPQDSQKSEGQGQHNGRLNDARGSTSQSQSKEKVEENGPRKFPIPRNMLTSMNGDSAGPSKDSTLIVTPPDSKLTLPVEPPQKKRAFQMSAHEDSFELDDDIHANGHTSFPIVESKKPETSLVANKSLSADVIQTPTPLEVSKTPAPAEVTPVLPEVAKIPSQPDLKEADDAKSPPKTDFGFFGGSASEQSVGLKFSTTPPSSAATQTTVLSKSTSQMDKISPQKDSNVFPSFGKTAEKVSQFQFSANEPSEFKPNANSDPKPVSSSSLFSSVTKNEQEKFLVFNKNDDTNDQKSTNILEESESLSPAVPTIASTSGIFSFGSSTRNSSTSTNVTPTSNPPIFSSPPPFPSFATNENSLFNNNNNNNSSSFTPSTTTATTSSVFSTSVPPPVFSFGSSITPTSSSTAPTTSVAETTNEKEPKSNTTNSPFATTSFPATTTAGSSLFGFSSLATTSTTNNQSQASFFNAASSSQATTHMSSTAVTQAVPFQFGSSGSSPATTSTTSGSFFNAASGSPATTQTVPFQFNSSTATSGGSLFGSSAPSFGITSETKPASGSTSNMFGSAFGSTPSVFSFGASSSPMPTPTPTTSPVMFGSSNTSSSTGFSFATNSSFAPPSVFGNSTPVFGASPNNNNNNDQMSMEDSMAEDSMQTPSPVSAFGQTPGFQFGLTTPTQTQTPAPTAAPFQFGGQPSQVAAQNPFQASGSVEFNAGGGSFSLGSGGGDKSGRRIVRVKNKNRRK